MALPTLRQPLQNLKVYEAKDAFYIVGQNLETDKYHILHVGRGTNFQHRRFDSLTSTQESSADAFENQNDLSPQHNPAAANPPKERSGFAGLFGGTPAKDKPTADTGVTGRLAQLFGGGSKEEEKQQPPDSSASALADDLADPFPAEFNARNEDTDSGDLFLFQEPQMYSLNSMKARLKELEKQSPGEDFNFVCSACGILGFIKLVTHHMLVLITQRKKVGVLFGNYIYTIKQTKTIQLNKKFFFSRESRDEAKCRNLLASLDMSKDFYFSYGYDLTNTLQSLVTEGGVSETVSCPPPEVPVIQCNTMFAWNFYMMRPIITADPSTVEPEHWMLPVVHGFFQQRLIRVGKEALRLSLISRRSRHFAGTRFLRRGVNDNGHCANEVETEQIVALDTTVVDNEPRVTSMVQMRGSIPLFWSHRNISSPKPDVVIHEEKGVDATYKHFGRVLDKFGGPCCVLNLIRQKEKKPIELLLFHKFNATIDELTTEKPPESNHPKLPLYYKCYDFINNTRDLGDNALDKLAEISQEVFPDIGFFSHQACDLPGRDAPRLKKTKDGKRCQQGVLRTNCIDCLDRTNIAQFCYGRLALKNMLDDLDIRLDANAAAEVDRVFMEVFVENGDTIARQYGGSPSMHRLVAEENEEFEGNKEFAVKGGMKNAMIATQRYISNNFMDADRQQAMDLFLGITIPRKTTLYDRIRKMSVNQLNLEAINQENNVPRNSEKELQELEAQMREGDDQIRAEEEANSAFLIAEAPLLRSVVLQVPRLGVSSDAKTKLVSFEKIRQYDFNIPESSVSATDGSSNDINLSRKLMTMHSKRTSLTSVQMTAHLPRVTHPELPVLQEERTLSGSSTNNSPPVRNGESAFPSSSTEEFYARYIGMDDILGKPKANSAQSIQSPDSVQTSSKKVPRIKNALRPQPPYAHDKRNLLINRKICGASQRIKMKQNTGSSITETTTDSDSDAGVAMSRVIQISSGINSDSSDSETLKDTGSLGPDHPWLLEKIQSTKAPVEKDPGYEAFSDLIQTSPLTPLNEEKSGRRPSGQGSKHSRTDDKDTNGRTEAKPNKSSGVPDENVFSFASRFIGMGRSAGENEDKTTNFENGKVDIGNDFQESIRKAVEKALETAKEQWIQEMAEVLQDQKYQG